MYKLALVFDAYIMYVLMCKTAGMITAALHIKQEILRKKDVTQQYVS